jgi:hypothetical protein
MLPASIYLKRPRWSRPGALTAALFSAASLVLTGGVLRAQPAPGTTPGSGSLSQYLADHQDELAPFFTRNSANLVSDAFHNVITIAGETMAIVLIATWILDLVLARSFSILIAPAYANMNRALIYASGRLVLNLILSAVLARDLTSCLTLMGVSVTTLLVMVLLSVSALVVQVVWFYYVYRCSLPNATAFYLVLLVIHWVALLLIVPIFFSGQVDRSIRAYVDQSIAPRLHLEAEAARHETEAVSGPRDAVKNQVGALTARVSAAQAEEQTLQKEIDDQKNSAGYAFGGLVKIRAQGNLAEAHTEFTAFLQRFPNGPIALAARGQLSEIDKALAAQAEMKRQQAADAARVAAQARANLLARAAAGQATLSEVRLFLLGKTRAEVNALFGAPTETGSDRWGYAQRMIFNPLDDSHRGLTVNFSEGLVQGVDYYYGSAP